MKDSLGLYGENILLSQEHPRCKGEFFETFIKQSRNQYINVFRRLGDSSDRGVVVFNPSTSDIEAGGSLIST